MDLLPLPAFDDNYVWLLRDGDGRAVVVDPGDAAPVLRALADAPPPLGILLTHHHGDHVGGVAELLRHWSGTPVFGPDDPRIPHASRRVADGDRIELGPFAFEVIAVLGHTRSHVAYHGAGLLFCGDTLFSLGCGRLFEGSPAQMLDSLDRLSRLPAATVICCAHEYTLANAAFALAVEPGNPALPVRVDEVRRQREAGQPSLPTTLASELACNPFLRSREPALRATLAARMGRAPADDVEAFAWLRQWKDGFTA